MRVVNSILELIGMTPIVQLNRISADCKANVYLKLESFNPGKSVKDRAANFMIHQAEEAGLIFPGQSTIIEPTSGNTGIGLAMVCAAKGYRCVITMPNNASEERIMLMKAYGAEVYLTEAEERMQGAIRLAEQLAKEIPHSYIPMQFNNQANPDAHRGSTAVEIYQAFSGKLDALVLTAGTGGTITGVGEELKKSIPNLKIYVVEPAGSPVLAGGNPGPHQIPGTGPGFIPNILNPKVFDEICHIKDEDAKRIAGKLGVEEGVLVGTSSAAAVYFALKVAKELPATARVLAIAPDSGERYLSTGLFGSSESTAHGSDLK